MLLLLGAMLAVTPAVYAEMFPIGNRASGMAIPYAIAVAAFGGTAPLLMTAWKPHQGWFEAYAIAMLVISGLVALTLNETKGIDLSQQHAHMMNQGSPQRAAAEAALRDSAQ